MPVSGKGRLARALAWVSVGMLQLIAGIGLASAESAGCTTVNGLNGRIPMTSNQMPTRFLPGDTLTVTFRDNGRGPRNDSSGSDAVILGGQGAIPQAYDYRTSGGTTGPHSITLPANFLTSNGLFVNVITSNGFIDGVNLQCTSSTAPPLTAPSLPLPAMTVGNSIDLTLIASGGTPPYAFTVTGGRLPTGLLLSSSGRLTGAPSESGTYNATVTVTDAANATTWVSYSGTVRAGIPDAPTAVVATGGDGEASVSFQAPSGTGGAPISRYVVTASSGVQATGTGSPIRVPGLANGVPVQFRVRAENGAQVGPESDPSNTLIPQASQTISFTGVSGQDVGMLVPLTATASSGLPVQYTSYTPLVCAIEGGNSVRLLTTGYCNLMADQPGTASIARAPSVLLSFFVVPATASAPTMRRAERVGATGADVYFDAPASTGGSPITTYEVITLPGAAVVTGAASPVRVAGLQPGSTYTFLVRARTASGPGALSLASNPVTLPGVPRMTAVQVPAAGHYAAGDTLAFQLVFDQPVLVTGTPQLMLVIGSERVAAQYDAGSGGTTLGFRYTVLPGQRDLDGIGIESLGLNGGTLRNADGISAVLSLAGVGSTAGITVGTVAPDAPTITGVSADDGTATVTFDPPLQNGGGTVLGYTITVQPGGLQVPVAQSPAVLTDLRNGTAYRFTVAARNTAGTGAASALSAPVVPMGEQQIQFADPGPQDLGTTPRLTATASSLLPVQWATTTPAVCSVAADGTLTLLTAGSCGIDADQPGDAATRAAARVSHRFAVRAVVPGAAAIVQVVLVSSDTAEVNFVAPAFDGGSPITGYLLQALPGGQSVRGAGSPLRIGGLPTGIAQRFTVTAINSVGSGAASAPSDALTVLNAPRVLRVTPPAAGRYLAGQVLEFQVGFDQALQVGAPPVLQLRIGAHQREALLLAQAADAQGTVLRFGYTVQADDLDEDGIAVETLQAAAGSLRNAQGTAAATALQGVGSTVAVLVGVELPGAPMDVRGVAADGQVQVHFVAPARAGSGAILDYTVSAQPGGITATGSGSPITVTGLANGTAYRFTVVARSEHGQGTASAASAAVTPLPVLGAADSRIGIAYGAAATVLPLTLQGTATRVDIVRAPQHGTVEVQGATLRYTPHAGYAGTDSVEYTASDAFSTSAPATVTITVAAPSVAIDDIAPGAATAGSAFTLALTSRGGRAPYRYALVGGAVPSGMALTPAGQLTGTPVVAGRFTVEVEVTDSSTGDGPFQARRSVVLVVDAPQILPGDTAPPEVVLGQAVSTRLPVRGGVAPYAFRLLSGALPPGVRLTADGLLEGTATQAGTFDVQVEVRDAHGFTAALDYRFAVAQATQAISAFVADPGSPVFSAGGSFLLSAQGGASGQPVVFASTTPAVCSLDGARVLMLSAGRCSLTADQAGDGNHHAATQQRLDVDIAAAVPVLAWQPDMARVLEQGSFDLPLPTSASPGAFTFHSSAPAVASIEGRTVHVHAEGTTVITAQQAASGGYAAARVELRLSVNVRPDPTRDPGVTGLLQAQVDASVRFANAQQGNIRDRLRQVRDGGNAASNTLSLSSGGGGPTATSLPLGSALGTGAAWLPAGWGSWASGTATYGRAGATAGARYDLRSDGLSVGVDRRLGEHALLGVAGSVGRNDSDQDDDRTRLRADQRSLALYGLWRGNAHLYVDAMIATGNLQFDLQRWSTDADALAQARRDGTQWFGSFGLGYEQVVATTRLTGYARWDASRTTLDAYREHGLGVLDLAYGRQIVDNRTLALGLEGSAQASAETRLRPFWSIEYRRALQDRGMASLNYATWSRPQDYQVALRSYNDDVLSLQAGVDVAIQRGWILSLLLGHEQARGADRASSIGLRLTSGGQGGTVASPPVP
ncbi:fibronectin type III domain-containing protein [Stenotrophomonas sp. GZD-301]|uniref:fibronectin type III domain-containing protein n=1 Tax=Stenotrophomonas sp. GZD-301 TaxID=3404814 RepID=UPI003BB53C69